MDSANSLQEHIDYINAQISEMNSMIEKSVAAAEKLCDLLPKVRLYTKSKGAIVNMLKSYGYSGSEAASFIHKIDDKDNYVISSGELYYVGETCRYLLYSTNQEKNTDLQVMLALQELPVTTLYRLKNDHKPFESGISRFKVLSNAEIKNLSIANRFKYIIEFRCIVQNTIYTLNNRLQVLKSFDYNVGGVLADSLNSALNLSTIIPDSTDLNDHTQ